MNLSVKVMIVPISISMIALGVMGYLATNEVNKRVTMQVREESLLTVSLFDADVGTLDAVLDVDQIQNLMSNLVKERPEIVRFTFHGPVYEQAKIVDYRMLAGSDPTLIWSEIPPGIKNVIANDEIVTRPTRVDGQSAVDVTMPIHVSEESVAALEILMVIGTDGTAEAARDRALWIAHTVDASVSTTEDLLYTALLQQTITTLVHNHSEIARLSLHGPVYQQPPVLEYRKIASTDRQMVGELSEPEVIAPIVSDETVLASVVMEGKEFLQVIAPIHVDRKAVATVDLLVSLDNVRAETRRIVRFLTVATLVTILLTIFLSVTLLGRAVIRPLSQLTASAQAMAAGDLRQEVKISSKDEVGILTNAFNSMAAQLRESIATLEQRVAERKRAEEARERLNAQLRAKNTELEQIVYVTSHDLRSPLVNVQGFSKELEIAFREVASAIESEGVPSEVKERLTPLLEEDIPEAVRFILTSISKMDALLSGLLRLSRLGRVALTIEELDMNSLMSDIAAASEFQIKEQGVTLDIGELPPCKGDKAQITQVFSNLLDNALKYLDPGRSGIIHIAGRKKQEKVIYCVEDNGIGIAQTHQEKIFEIFQRFDPNIASGEGLGLTIVRRILDRCHGKIWVESEPGKGSRFFVALPAVR